MIVVIFRSRLRADNAQEYRDLAPSVLELARSVPGFVSFKSFTAEDGERASIIEFVSLEAVDRWRDDVEHRKAQVLGRQRFYSEYHLQVCSPVRSYSFQGGKRTEHVVD